jgi:hypothetical protein
MDSLFHGHRGLVATSNGCGDGKSSPKFLCHLHSIGDSAKGMAGGSLHIFASKWMAWQVPVNVVRHQSLLFSSI